MNRPIRYLAAGVIVCAVFLSSYSFALAHSKTAIAANGAQAQSVTGTAGSAAAGVTGPAVADTVASPGSVAGQSGVAAAGCACCGGGAQTQAETVRAEAKNDGGVQRIAVGTSTGAWSPNEIVLKAGVPAQITFAEGQGCLAQVLFPELGVQADLTHGGAVVNLPALKAGTYSFSCGMRMVFGSLIVQ